MAEAKKQNNAQIKVTLIRGINHILESQKKTIEALGLKKIGGSKIHNNNEAIKGMIFKVKHLVRVENV